MPKAFMHPTKIINETESVSPRTAGLGILVALYPPFPAHGFRRSAFRVGYPLGAPNGDRSIESWASHPDLRSLVSRETKPEILFIGMSCTIDDFFANGDAAEIRFPLALRGLKNDCLRACAKRHSPV